MYGDVPGFMKDIPGMNKLMLIYVDGTGADVQAWELGVKFQTPKTFDQLTWFRDGQWTDYPADHIGTNFGSAKRDALSFSSSKRNTIWACLSNPAGEGVTLLATSSPLHVRAKGNGDNTMLFASTMICAQRSFSSGYLDQYRIRLKQGQTYSSRFSLALTKN